ncbi:MAG TPA: ABC transporter substrate-binding protein [Limnochordales bacterium]
MPRRAVAKMGSLAVAGAVVAAALMGPLAVPSLAGQSTYTVALLGEPTTTNVFAQLGPQASVWNFAVVLYPMYGALYGLAAPRWDLVPGLAADLPGPLRQERGPDGATYWTGVVRLRQGLRWQDGTPVTADDVAWTYNTILQLDPVRLGGNWPDQVHPDYLVRVEKLGDDAVKFWFRRRPGIAVWQFGVLQAVILQRRTWEPVVRRALASEDPVQALLAAEVVPESLGGWVYQRWERGAFFENRAHPYNEDRGSRTELYPNGAVRVVSPRSGYTWQTRDPAPQGEPELVIESGPFFDTTLYRFYQNQNAAVLALIRGQVDFILNPSGLQRGFQEQLARAAGVSLVSNPANGFRYLAFNLRRPPFHIKAFRQAVATVIDREFVAGTVLQGTIEPLATFVPPGNAYWHNPDVKLWGQGMSRAQRVAEAVRLLKEAGFSWEREPQVDLASDSFQPGEGLRMPGGEPVRPLELLAPSPGYDPLRATFALWVERWLRDLGVPVRTRLADFNTIVNRTTQQHDFDMYILGWGLTLFPDYLRSFFHSSNAGPGGFNTPGYRNPDFDRLADRLLEVTELDEARAIAFQLQAILAEELPYVVLFTTPILEAYRSDRVRYPFTEVLDGIQGGGMAGMPSLVKAAR